MRRRRKTSTRDILATLALVGAIFVSVLSLPYAHAHQGACRIVSTLSNQPTMPCGLSELSISLDISPHPHFSLTIRRLLPPISL